MDRQKVVRYPRGDAGDGDAGMRGTGSVNGPRVDFGQAQPRGDPVGHPDLGLVSTEEQAF